MHILLLLNSRFPTQKAYGLQVQTMARGFAESGDEVTVAYPRRSTEQPPDIAGVRFFPYGPLLPLVVPWLFHLYRLFGLVGLRRVLREVRPDVCLVNDPVQAAWLPQPWKVIWDVHDLPDPRRSSRLWLIRRVLKRAQGLLSTSQRKLDRLASMYQPLPPAIVLPNPVTFDPETYQRISREEARARCGLNVGFAIVYAGQLYDWKGVDTLVEAAAFLSPDETIHIVGGQGEDLARCQRLAANLAPGSAKVQFIGLRPPEEIPYWLRAADVVVIPNSGKYRLSVEDTNPLKAIEAMAAGAKIVASDLPALRETLSGYVRAHFSTADDPKALAQAIQSERTSGDSTQQQEPPILTGKARAMRIHAFVVASISGGL